MHDVSTDMKFLDLNLNVKILGTEEALERIRSLAVNGEEIELECGGFWLLYGVDETYIAKLYYLTDVDGGRVEIASEGGILHWYINVDFGGRVLELWLSPCYVFETFAAYCKDVKDRGEDEKWQYAVSRAVRRMIGELRRLVLTYPRLYNCTMGDIMVRLALEAVEKSLPTSPEFAKYVETLCKMGPMNAMKYCTLSI